MRKGVGVIVAVLATVGVLAGPAYADDHTLKGSLTLQQLGFGAPKPGDECHGFDLASGYNDIDRGAQVRVRDGDGKTLAISKLGKGEHAGDYCRWTFKVSVPDADFYEIEVSRRGGLTYSSKQLDKKHWKVAFTLGDGS